MASSTTVMARSRASSNHARAAIRRRLMVMITRARNAIQDTHRSTSGGPVTGGPSPTSIQPHGPPSSPGTSVEPTISRTKVRTSPVLAGWRAPVGASAMYSVT